MGTFKLNQANETYPTDKNKITRSSVIAAGIATILSGSAAQAAYENETREVINISQGTVFLREDEIPKCQDGSKFLIEGTEPYGNNLAYRYGKCDEGNNTL